MKRTLATLVVSALLVGQAQADLIFGGDFGLYVTGTAYTVTAELSHPGGLNSYAKGVGDGTRVLGTPGEAYGADGSTNKFVDLPGWTIIHGGEPDTGRNGVGDSSGMNIFAAWGGKQRVETSAAVGTVAAGSIYTITAQIDGVSGGPMDGPLAFHLMANGVELTATAPIPSFTATPGTFQTFSRTYDLSTLPDGVSAGDDLTIILGVEDTNLLGNRMIWDDVSLTVVPPQPRHADLTEVVRTPLIPGPVTGWAFVRPSRGVEGSRERY